MLAIKGASGDYDTHTYCLCPTLNYVSIRHVFHGLHIVALLDTEAVYYLRTWHWCDQVLL